MNYSTQIENNKQLIGEIIKKYLAKKLDVCCDCAFICCFYKTRCLLTTVFVNNQCENLCKLQTDN